MSAELLRAGALLAALVLVLGTGIGAVRAMLGLTAWSRLTIPGLACAVLVVFVAWAVRAPARRPVDTDDS